MVRERRPRVELRTLLERVEAAAPIAAVDVVAHELSTMVGALNVDFLMADVDGEAVIRLDTRITAAPGGRRNEVDRTESIPVAGTAYERVLRTQQADVSTRGASTHIIVPVTDRGDVLGVLEVELPGQPDPSIVEDVAAAGHVLAYIVIANRRYTDLFEWGHRGTPFSLAAEIQHRLLPSAYTCEAGQFTLAGCMEPASSVGGDTFDYSLDRHSLQLSITDAVGHDVAAALLATLCVGGLRNGRRRGLDLAAQAGTASDALAEKALPGLFVTGQLVQVDLRTGQALIVNAGHPLPLRLRAGRVEEVDLAVDVPFGVEAGWPYRVQELQLLPGDRLVFQTDGMQERNAAALDVRETLNTSADLHPREVVRALGDAVMRATGGELHDDATVLCLDWYGGPMRARISDGGAAAKHASR